MKQLRIIQRLDLSACTFLRFAGAFLPLTILGMLFAAASLAIGEEPDSSEEAPVEKLKVFIFAGQSNMVGRSDPKLLPEEYRRPLEGVRLYANHTWRELAGPLTGRQDGIGPEISAARLLAETFAGEKIVIVKSAVGGTNLHTQWNPKLKGSLYAKMLEDVSAATAGEEYEVVAMFWAQGGADTKNEEGAKAYGKNLAAFIAQARKDFGRDDLPFLFSGTKTVWPGPPSPRYPFYSEVTKGKLEVAKSVPHTVLVSTDRLSRIGGVGHYDTAGTIEFGRRFFQAWKDHFHSPKPQVPSEE